MIIFAKIEKMFDREVYSKRRERLACLLSEKLEEGNRGIAVFLGNVDAPCQYLDNGYKFRQDSTWLYYFGIDIPRFAAIFDLDEGKASIYSDDYGIDDIIWTGAMPMVSDLADEVGVGYTGSYEDFSSAVRRAQKFGRPVHFIPQYRYYNMALLNGLGLKEPSKALCEAIIEMRLRKEDIEIEELDKACDLGIAMHTLARNAISTGIIEQDIVGKMEGFALSKGWGVSFPTILTQHGEVFHSHAHDKLIEPGKLVVVDAGVESNSHYASDFTRTYPTSGRFSQKQRDIYQIVCDCNELAFSMIAPGVRYRDVHLGVAAKMLDGLKVLGLVKGDIDTMVAEGVAGLFMPHGLGHNMGLDVHDMESIGEDLVGYDNDQVRSTQLGLRSLRMARSLKPGNVLTDEPGIYFIPQLIENWKKEGKAREFINYEALKDYYDFGGIRLEDDVLVTESGARRLGHSRLPIQPDDVEAAMKH